MRRGLRIEPLLVGGEQERGRRAGLEDVAGAIGFGAAAAALTDPGPARRRVGRRPPPDRAPARRPRPPWPASIPYGDPERRVPHIVCLGVDGVEAEPVLLGLDQAGVAVHSGSSCSSESLEPSPVLEAMGVDGERSLRLSVGWSTTDADVDAFVAAFPGVVAGSARCGPEPHPPGPDRRRTPETTVADGRLAAMRAVVCNEFGPLDTLVVEERPTPEPGEGHGGGRRGRPPGSTSSTG